MVQASNISGMNSRSTSNVSCCWLCLILKNPQINAQEKVTNSFFWKIEKRKRKTREKMVGFQIVRGTSYLNSKGEMISDQKLCTNKTKPLKTQNLTLCLHFHYNFKTFPFLETYTIKIKTNPCSVFTALFSGPMFSFFFLFPS